MPKIINAYFYKNRPYFLTGGRWAAAWAKCCSTLFLCPASMAQRSNMAEAQKTTRPKHNRKAIADQVNCKHTNFWARSLIISHHNHLIENCHMQGTMSEAVCASQRAHTISCGHAMCRLGLFFPMISHLRVQSLALATIFSIALPHALPLLLPAMQVCPFVATCVTKGFCPQPWFGHWICRTCFYPSHIFASVFCHQCCRYLCPRRFFPFMLPCKLPKPLPLPLLVPSRFAMVVAIKSGRLIQASDKVVPVLGKKRCALGKCVSQKSCL